MPPRFLSPISSELQIHTLLFYTNFFSRDKTLLKYTMCLRGDIPVIKAAMSVYFAISGLAVGVRVFGS